MPFALVDLAASSRALSNGFCNGYMPLLAARSCEAWCTGTTDLLLNEVHSEVPLPVAALPSLVAVPVLRTRARACCWCLCLCLSAGIYWPRFDTWACCELSLGGFNASSRVSSFLVPLLPSLRRSKTKNRTDEALRVFVRPYRRLVQLLLWLPSLLLTGVFLCPATHSERLVSIH